MSFAQQRLWFLDRLEPGSAAYNVPLAVRLHGPLDADSLARSLAQLGERHEALRTRLVTVDGQPRQEIVDAGFTLAGRDAGAGEVEQLARAEAEGPFDLAT